MWDGWWVFQASPNKAESQLVYQASLDNVDGWWSVLNLDCNLVQGELLLSELQL